MHTLASRIPVCYSLWYFIIYFTIYWCLSFGLMRLCLRICSILFVRSFVYKLWMERFCPWMETFMCKGCLTGAWCVRNTYWSTSELQWNIFLCHGDERIVEARESSECGSASLTTAAMWLCSRWALQAGGVADPCGAAAPLGKEDKISSSKILQWCYCVLPKFVINLINCRWLIIYGHAVLKNNGSLCM